MRRCCLLSNLLRKLKAKPPSQFNFSPSLTLTNATLDYCEYISRPQYSTAHNYSIAFPVPLLFSTCFPPSFLRFLPSPPIFLQCLSGQPVPPQAPHPTRNLLRRPLNLLNFPHFPPLLPLLIPSPISSRNTTGALLLPRPPQLLHLSLQSTSFKKEEEGKGKR